MLSLSGPWTHLGAILSALIVVLTIIGITMHRDFYAGHGRKDFFCFYTNISNLAVLVYFALIAPRLYANPALHVLIAHMEFSVMMSIMLTCAVFHLALYPAIRLAAQHMKKTKDYWIVWTDNLIIHYLVPLSVFAYWVLCSPGKQTLRAQDALYWTALPVLYIGYTFLRAHMGKTIEELDSRYPYPFLDIQALGGARVLGVCAALYMACLLAGLFAISSIRILCS